MRYHRRYGLFIFGLILSLGGLSNAALGEIKSVDQTLDVQLEPATRSLNVRAELSIQGGGEISFYLSPNLILTGFRLDGQPAPQGRHGDVFRLNLGPTGLHNLTLEYRGLLSRPSAANDYNRSPQIASEAGSYLAAGSAWHPIIPGTNATYRVNVTVPETQKALVPGKLLEEKTAGGFYHAAYQSEIGAEGIVLIAGPFAVSERKHGDILLRTYFPKPLASLAPDYLDSTVGYVDRYSELIGAYPFSSFSIVSGPLPVGLGFSGMTYIGERVLQLPFIRFTSLGHEVLHNWWGNGIEVDYETGNWAEGLTTYMADYAFSKERNEDDGERSRLEWLRDYAALPPRRDHPVTSFVSRSHDAAQIIGYNKVAFIFHMLERQLGDKNFQTAIQTFWNRYRLSSAGWQDIRKVCEEISGQDLGLFFDQWLNRTGSPKLVVSDVVRHPDRVAFTLTQPELPYSLNVPIRLTTLDSEKMYQAHIDGKASRIELPLPAAPVSLSIDPGFDIFRRLDATEAPPILRDTTLNANTRVVLVGLQGTMEQTAQDLASRLLDARPRYADPRYGMDPSGPLLVIGQTAAVQQFLHQGRLPKTPGSLVGQGSARVWASRTPASKLPLLVVEANDEKALQALLRPLPHYGRRGFLIFQGSKTTENGTWPAQAGPLTVQF